MDTQKIYLEASKLSLLSPDTGKGDCIEVDVNPEDIRKYSIDERFKIRKLENGKWRIWRKK